MAVWDQFLTERDKKHLAVSWEKKEPFGFGVRPALLIVDVYYAAVGDTPRPILESVKTWPASCGLEGWEAIYKTQDLLRCARGNGIPVIYCTRAIEDFPSHGRRTVRQSRLPEDTSSIQFQIVEEIAPEVGELVVHKAAASAFFGTPLVGHLIYLSIDTVIACGETTSGCVRASVVDGCAHRFRMGVVEECTFDRTQAAHAINLFDMQQKYADVISLTEAITYFERVGKSRWGSMTKPI